MNRVHAVVTAAGSSRRMGGIDKLTLAVNGLPLLIRTLQPFLEFPPLGELVVTVNPERVSEFRALFEQHLPEYVSRLHVTEGGENRQQSILFGLRLVAKFVDTYSNDKVMIHDGARPFVTPALFQALLDRLHDFEGAIPALPVRDTVKRVRGSEVLNTEDRETLRLVQTPQVFPLKLISQLHERAAKEDFLGTDDASLLEHYGHRVGWVEGPVYNLKITLPEDLEVLHHLYQQNKAEPAT